MSAAKLQVSGLNSDWDNKIWMGSCLSSGVKVSLYEVEYDKVLETDPSKCGVAFNTYSL